MRTVHAVACGRAAPPGALVLHRRAAPRRLPQLERATGGGTTATRTDPRVGRRARRAHRIDPPRRAGPGGRRLHRRRVRHRHRRGPGRELGRPLGRPPRPAGLGAGRPHRHGPPRRPRGPRRWLRGGGGRRARLGGGARTGRGQRRPSSASWPTRGAATQPCCSGDGRVLVVGGWVASHTYTATSEVIDPDAGTIVAGPDLPFAGDALDAVALGDGRILVAGGQVAPGRATDRAAVLDPGGGGVACGRPAGHALGSSTSWWRSGTVGRWCSAGRRTTRRCSRPPRSSIRTPSGSAPGPACTSPATSCPVARWSWATTSWSPVGAAPSRTSTSARGRSRVLAEQRVRGSFATINRLGRRDLLVIGGYDGRIRLRREAFVLPAPGR